MIEKQIDTITETRTSTEQTRISFWLRLKSFVCPCLLPRPNPPVLLEKDSGAAITSVHSRTSETNHSNNHYKFKQTFQVNEHVPARRNTKRKNSMEFQENEKKEGLLKRNTKLNKEFRETINIQLGYNYRMCSIDELDCAVCNLTEDVLLTAGAKNRQLLLKVSRVNISIRLALLKREINKKQKTERIEQKKYGEFEFNKHWEQRYILFEKFDEGIKIDENSWTINPPEQVSQYIANKCNGAKIILDAFAGVGGTTIKLANINSCAKVIANQTNKKRMGFLLNNAKVYEVDSNIELSQNDFLSIQRSNIDVVIAQPPLTDFHVTTEHKEIIMSDFYPSLDTVILQSFKLASNLILLLPPETSIDSLCSCINNCASQLKKMREFCSIKIEKIYCQMSIKYILVCVGTLVQTEVKLNDELEYLYTRLKKPGEVYFKHKKVMKKLREDYGMLELFNLVKESERVRRESVNSPEQRREQHAIDFFYELIRRKDLIPNDKLSKIITQQDAEYQRQSSYFHSITLDDNEFKLSPMMEEEKIDENPFNIREAQLTQSEYSHYTYHSSFDKKSNNNKSHRSSALLMRERTDKSNPSIIINRINDSKDKNEHTNSPLTPPAHRLNRGGTLPLDSHRIAETPPRDNNDQ